MTANARGSLYMAIGSLGYVVNDALVRLATEEGLDVYQALFLRGVAMAVFFAGVGAARGERLTRSHVRAPLVIRVIAELGGSAFFFAALVHLEFANAQTIIMLVPFAVTLTAALLLGEWVTKRHYLTILAGFVGVIAVMRPATGEFSYWVLLPLASAACLVVREFATRAVETDTPAVSIAFVTALSLSLLTALISFFTGWGDITTRALVILALACICLVIGYVFSIQTVRVGDISVSAPFRYTTLLGAVVLGYAMFDEVPDALTIVGCTVIVFAGLYSIRLERDNPLVSVGAPPAPEGL